MARKKATGKKAILDMDGFPKEAQDYTDKVRTALNLNDEEFKKFLRGYGILLHDYCVLFKFARMEQAVFISLIDIFECGIINKEQFLQSLALLKERRDTMLREMGIKDPEMVVVRESEDDNKVYIANIEKKDDGSHQTSHKKKNNELAGYA